MSETEAKGGGAGRLPLVFASISVVSGMLLLSNALGFVRDLLAGRTFGATGATDAFFAAHALVSVFTLFFLAGTVQGALLPRYVAREADGRTDLATSVARRALVLVTCVSVVFAAAIFLAAEPLVRLLYGGFDAERAATAVEAVRWLAPTIVAAGLGAVAQSVLHARRRFSVPACIPPISNLLVIAAILGLSGVLGVQALSAGYLAGGMLWLFVALPLAWSSLRGGGPADPADERKMIAAFAALAALVVFDSLSGLVQRSILSFFEEGVLASFGFGIRIAGLPVALVGTALAIVLFPRMAAAAARSPAEFATTFRFGFVTALTALAPIAAFCALEARPIVDLLFGGGAFDATAVGNTATVLAIYGAAMPAQALIVFLERAYLAAERAKLVVRIAIGAGVLQVALTYALVPQLGWIAVPIGTLVYGYVHAAALFWLSMRFIEQDLPALGASCARIAIGCVGAAVVLLAPASESPIFLVVRAAVFGLTFIALLYLIGERTWLRLLGSRA